MQFGGSPRVFQVGCVFLAMMLGASMSFAQVSLYGQLSQSSTDNQNGQTSGNTSGQQQSCNPSDPSCQTNDYQGRNSSRTSSQPASSSGNRAAA